MGIREQIEDAKQAWKLAIDKNEKQIKFNELQALWMILREEQGEFQCKPKKSY